MRDNDVPREQNYDWEFDIETTATHGGDESFTSPVGAALAISDAPLSNVQIQFSPRHSTNEGYPGQRKDDDHHDDRAVPDCSFIGSPNGSVTDWLPHSFSRHQQQTEQEQPLLYSERLLCASEIAAAAAAATSTNDDDESVNSAPYFEPTDFKKTNWTAAMDAPTVGIAVLGLAVALTHPILFLAAAATAFGTATAASRGYDCFVDGTCSGWYNKNNYNNSSNKYAVHHDDVDTTTLELAETDSTSSNRESSSALVQSPLFGGASLSTSNTTTATMAGVALAPKNNSAAVGKESSKTLTGGSTIMHTPPDDWWDSQYPVLPQAVVANQQIVGLNVIECFRVFFANDAPYCFKEFQKKRGDLDISYGPWKARHLASHLATQPLSMHPDATLVSKRDLLDDPMDYYSYQTRVLKFQAKTNNGLMGPAYATTQKTQRFIALSKRKAILESKTVLSNIPFSDRFFLMERWSFEATKDAAAAISTDNNGGGAYYTTALTVTMGIFFSTSCPFEGPIRHKSSAAVTDVVQAWCRMATQALEFTRQAKLQRLYQSNGTFDSNAAEAQDDENDTFGRTKQKQGSVADGSGQVRASSIQCTADGQHGFRNDSEVLALSKQPTMEKRRRQPLMGLRRSWSQIVGRPKGSDNL
jgi:hypothetical protein